MSNLSTDDTFENILQVYHNILFYDINILINR